MANEKVTGCDVVPALSVTVIANVPEPVAVGVPLITPRSAPARASPAETGRPPRVPPEPRCKAARLRPLRASGYITRPLSHWEASRPW